MSRIHRKFPTDTNGNNKISIGNPYGIPNGFPTEAKKNISIRNPLDPDIRKKYLRKKSVKNSRRIPDKSQFWIL